MSYKLNEYAAVAATIALVVMATVFWLVQVDNSDVVSYEYKVVDTTPYTEAGYTTAILEGHGDKFHIETDEYILPGDVLYHFCIKLKFIELCRFKRHIPYKEFKYVDQ